MRWRSYQYDGFSIISYRSDIIDEMSYLLSTDDQHIVIDPHEDDDMLSDLDGVGFLTIILTHEHFDHISGVNWMREHFKVNVCAGEICAEKISRPKNGTELFPLLLIGNKKAYREFKQKYQLPYHCTIDHKILGDVESQIGSCKICIFGTPGHSQGSISVLINNRVLFGGDSLLGNGEEFRSVDSDVDIYKSITLAKYNKLSTHNVTVFPGHGEPDTLQSIIKKQGF